MEEKAQRKRGKIKKARKQFLKGMQIIPNQFLQRLAYYYTKLKLSEYLRHKYDVLTKTSDQQNKYTRPSNYTLDLKKWQDRDELSWKYLIYFRAQEKIQANKALFEKRYNRTTKKSSGYILDLFNCGKIKKPHF